MKYYNRQKLTDNLYSIAIYGQFRWIKLLFRSILVILLKSNVKI